VDCHWIVLRRRWQEDEVFLGVVSYVAAETAKLGHDRPGRTGSEVPLLAGARDPKSLGLESMRGQKAHDSGYYNRNQSSHTAFIELLHLLLRPVGLCSYALRSWALY